MPPSERWTHITRNYAERYVLARIQRQLKRSQKHFPLWKYKIWPRAERAAKNWVRKFSPTLPAAISSKNRMLAGGVGWSTNKHGDDEAWVLAVKCRRMENENRDDVIDAVARMSPNAYSSILKQRR